MSGALEARQIPTQTGQLHSVVEGDIEAVEKVMRITEIRVHYHLQLSADMRAAAERAFETHAPKCPAAVSVRDCIRIKLDIDYEEG